MTNMLQSDIRQAFTGHRWIYALFGGFSLLLSFFFVMFIKDYLLPQQMIAASFCAFLLLLFFAIAAFKLIFRATLPVQIVLSVDGITLLNTRQRGLIEWSCYKGMRGGPSLLLQVKSATGCYESIPIGIWLINLEVEVYGYAKSHGISVAIRPDAHKQISAVSMLKVSIVLFCVAVLIIIYNISPKLFSVF